MYTGKTGKINQLTGRQRGLLVFVVKLTESLVDFALVF